MNVTTMVMLGLLLGVSIVALIVAILAYSEGNKRFDDVKDGFIPVKDGDRYISSSLRKHHHELQCTKSLAVPDNSLRVGGITISDGGTNVVAKVSGTETSQYFAVSDLEESGSTVAFYWKFGEKQELPPTIPFARFEVSKNGIVESIVTGLSNNLFNRFSYICDRPIDNMNIQVYINNTNGEPIYDYVRANGTTFSLVEGTTQVPLGKDVFFGEGKLLITHITNTNGDEFGIGGDDVNGGFFPTADIGFRSATKILLPDVNTTVASALTQFDIYVKVGSDSTLADGSTVYPFADIQSGVDASVDGQTMFVQGPFIITQPIVVDKSISIFGTQGEDTVIQYENWDKTNGSIMECKTAGTRVTLTNIQFHFGNNSLNIGAIELMVIRDCTFLNNGWDGIGVNFLMAEAALPPGTLAYDSTQIEKTTFFAGEDVAVSSAGMYAVGTKAIFVNGCNFNQNNIGIHMIDVGPNGTDIRESNFFNNLTHSVFLDASSGDQATGCVLVGIRNNGMLFTGGQSIRVIGGFDISIYDNFVRGCWGAAIEANDAGHLRIIGTNTDMTNMSATSADGVALNPAAIYIHGATQRPQSTFLADIRNCSLIEGMPVVPHDRHGIHIEEIANFDDIDLTTVVISTCTFNNFAKGIVFEANSITNLTSGERASRITLDGNVFKNTPISIDNIDTGNFSEMPYASSYTYADSLDASIDDAKQLITLDPGYSYSVNQLYAFAEGTRITIVEINKDRIQADHIDPTLVTINGLAPSALDIATVVNELNGLFVQSLIGGGTPPTITSSKSVNVVQNDPVTYNLTTTDNLGGVYWSSLPAGLTPSSGNNLQLIGSLATLGSFNANLTITNANGSTIDTVVFVVAAPPYSNTKSVDFTRSGGSKANVTVDTTFPLYRLDNASGTAWSVSTWHYQDEGNNQHLWEYNISGSTATAHIRLEIRGNGTDLRLRYGTSTQNIRITFNNVVTLNTWYNIVVTYDGGTTGNTGANVTDYYSRFTVHVNDTAYTYLSGIATPQNSSNGFTGGWDVSSIFTVGRRVSNSSGFGGFMDEVSIYNRVLSGAHITAIYNGGDASVDLVTDGLTPSHWYRMGDEDTFPTITDNVGTFDLTMLNMVPANIVNFVSP